MTEPTDPEPSTEASTDGPPATKGSTRGGRMAAAVGTAMLGLEHAMRNEPPAEVVVREHQPERGLSGADGDLIVGFPDDA